LYSFLYIIIVSSITVVFPKEGQMRFAGQASRSNKLAIYWAADYRNKAILDLEGYLRKLALRVTWPSFGNIKVLHDLVRCMPQTLLAGEDPAAAAGDVCTGLWYVQRRYLRSSERARENHRLQLPACRRPQRGEFLAFFGDTART
jgi:hypothetical protein